MAERRLTAILAADIAGYSALMGANDVETVAELKGHQSVVLPMIAGFSGRVIDTAGDGVLAEFASVFNAVKCALAIQEVMRERNASVRPERRMQFRIGINQGDVLFDDSRIYGDGINIAARLESICEPGSICISGKVYDEIQGRLEIHYADIGEQRLKNIAAPVRAYRISLSDAVSSSDNRATEKGPSKWPIGQSGIAASVAALFALAVGSWIYLFQPPASPSKSPTKTVLTPASAPEPAQKVVSSAETQNDTTAKTADFPPVAKETIAAKQDPAASSTVAAARHPADGIWEFNTNGNEACPIRSRTFRMFFRNGEIQGVSGKVVGNVSGDGDFRYTTPSAMDPRKMVESQGKVQNGTGQGTFRVKNGKCFGTYEIRFITAVH